MERQTASTSEEVSRLERCINDLVGVLALSAIWTGHESSHVANTLLDVLVRMLRLDFAYVRVTDSVEVSQLDWSRSADGGTPDIRWDEIGRAFESAPTAGAPTASLVLPNPLGEGLVSVALFRLGLHGDVGIFAAGSERKDFPTQVESLLLQVAANQAAIGLSEARHLRQQRHATRELEERVLERTAELEALNEELRKEILERTRSEERIRQDERELRCLFDFVPQFMGALNADGTIRYINRAALDYLGQTLEELIQSEDARARRYHPDDLATVRQSLERAFSLGARCDFEARVRRHDGVFRWFWLRYEPMRDEQGRVVRWYAAGVDIEERKQGEERTQAENVVLREEVDRASMFEEIVGASAGLRTVISQVSKVAPTDSTVLITGETGTGKELVARAIHKRSHRASRAFVSVTCAVIPPSLVASELFGHEKGAFTGAVQRRVGRFELAEGGTIFLDEVGELPAETQVALLRVLQEREFERVGGGRPIRIDVRVIAATNRDLEAAIAAGLFRADLFYRLNVFPVEMPSLRDRREDIPVLMRYFVDRYSRQSGKKIKNVSKGSLSLLQSYPWPGNVRELQNVIERSLIVSEGDTLTVDERWFLNRGAGVKQVDRPLTEQLILQEKTTIESALAETRGKVYGPTGAAAKLRMPPSTLESRIKALQIDKNRFKTTY